MKCINCFCCKKGWFPSKPNEYVCIGVKEPFVIDNVYAECPAYPEKRDYIGIEDAITHFKHGITHDIFSEPVTTYAKMAIEALEKQTPKKVVCDGDDESDHVYCPCCHECIGSNEIIWEDFYYRDWKPAHCPECGQAMIWK
jgi:hypothetical protein